MAAVFPAIDEALDRRNQVFDRGEAAAADRLACTASERGTRAFELRFGAVGEVGA